jgi:uncharacterized protein
MKERYLSPTAPGERIELLDVLRGFALIGILVVNVRYFSAPAYLAVSGDAWGAGPMDRVADVLTHFFVEGKFYSLFSLLFGVGLALQITRARRRGTAFVPLYTRRLFILLFIGMGHTFFLWFGDILVAYAVLGFVLLAFRNRSDRTILIASVVFLAFPILIQTLLYGLVEWGRSIPEMAVELEKDFAESHRQYVQWTQQSYEVYANGSYGDILVQRWADVKFSYLRFLFQGNGFQILGMFLLGLWAGRKEIFRDSDTYFPRLRRMVPWMLLVGLVANAVYVFASSVSNPAVPSSMGILKAIGFAVGAPTLCFVYVFAMAVLLQRGRGKSLAAVGRGALSSYLLQSVICTTVFYGYGLGLYGRWGPAASLVLVGAVALVQVFWSNWWFRRHRYGPAEWVWRVLTYGSRSMQTG